MFNIFLEYKVFNNKKLKKEIINYVNEQLMFNPNFSGDDYEICEGDATYIDENTDENTNGYHYITLLNGIDNIIDPFKYGEN